MKAAIITHYYNSNNYGGNLQAYALCKVLHSLGVEAEQLDFVKPAPKKRLSSLRKVARYAKKSISLLRNFHIAPNLKERNRSIREFNRNVIPHTKEVYTADTISDCLDNYDVFITGSVQVWHPIAYCPAYGLDFVPSGKIKMSYAASIACDEISEDYRSILRQNLVDFSGISVREEHAALLRKDIVSKPVVVSLDPTLLLSKEEWDGICTNQSIHGAYLFCYFLGDSTLQRNLAKEYAEIHQLKIVTLPYLMGDYRSCDKNFGDEKLYDVSPSDFLALVRGATAVFTDSFHATAFSVIYERPFVVFDRKIGNSMGSRLRGLVESIGLQERFCDTIDKNTIEYIDSLSDVHFDRVNAKIDLLKTDSIMYLKRCIYGEKNES